MTNTITIKFSSTNCNGYPKVKISLNRRLVSECEITPECCSVDIHLPSDPGPQKITIERYGKTEQNTSVVNNTIVADQILTIESISVDNVEVSKFSIIEDTVFESKDQIQQGIDILGFNGTWTFNFETPIITFLLDKKITHEAKYSQDYKYPWSYKLGPDSVTELMSEFEILHKKILNLYE